MSCLSAWSKSHTHNGYGTVNHTITIMRADHADWLHQIRRYNNWPPYVTATMAPLHSFITGGEEGDLIPPINFLGYDHLEKGGICPYSCFWLSKQFSCIYYLFLGEPILRTFLCIGRKNCNINNGDVRYLKGPLVFQDGYHPRKRTFKTPP